MKLRPCRTNFSLGDFPVIIETKSGSRKKLFIVKLLGEQPAAGIMN